MQFRSSPTYLSFKKAPKTNLKRFIEHHSSSANVWYTCFIVTYNSSWAYEQSNRKRVSSVSDLISAQSSHVRLTSRVGHPLLCGFQQGHWPLLGSNHRLAWTVLEFVNPFTDKHLNLLGTMPKQVCVCHFNSHFLLMQNDQLPTNQPTKMTNWHNVHTKKQR